MPATVTGTATDSLGAVASDSLTVTSGAPADQDKVVHYLARNRPNFSSLVDAGRQGPANGAVEAVEVGLRFFVQRACTLTGARIFKHPSATGSIPVTIWNYQTQAQLGTATVTWSADNGGWREFNLDAGVNLLPGIEYAISYFSNAWYTTGWRFNAQTYLEYPFTVVAGDTDLGDGKHAASGCYRLGSHGFPAVQAVAAWYWIDPRVEYDSPVATYKGGTEYFDQFPGWDLDAFPISVFSVDGGYFADYKSIGVNIPLPSNTREARDELVANSMKFLANGSTPTAAKTVVADPELSPLCQGWIYHDEPDIQGPGASPETLRATLVALRQIDSTRPAYFGFGNSMLQGQSFGWWPNGATAETVTANWRASAQLIDIVSGDDYSINTNRGIWNYGVQVDRLRDINDARTPVWAIIETCIQVGGVHNPTVDEMKRAAMLAIIHGARGLMWFDHQFPYNAPDGTSYPQDFQVLLHDSVKKAAITTFHGLLQALKGPLLAPESTLARTITSSNTTAGPVGGELGVPIHATLRESGGYIYLFAQAARPGTTTGTFTIPALAGATLTLQGESGSTITANGSGTFTVSFGSDYEYHILRAPVPAAPVITTTTLSPMREDVAFTQTLAAIGAIPMTWSVQSGSIAGLSLSSGGVLSGTPTTSGSATITIRATNASGHFDKSYTVTVDVPPVAPTITTTTMNDVYLDTSFTQTLAATGTSPFTWSVTSGALPTGLSLSSGGVITGTATSSGTGSVTVAAVGIGGTDTQVLAWEVVEAPPTEHSVFGSSAPEGTYTVNSDGGGSLTTANQFYTYGSPSHDDWQIVGARIWVPAGATGGVLSEGGHVYLLQNSDGGGAFDPTTDPSGSTMVATMVANGSATAFTTLTAGQWNDVYFDDEYPLNWGDGFFVGVKWTSGNYYMYRSTASTVVATDGAHLALAESVTNVYRGINSLSGTDQAVHYGIDAIIREA